MIQIMNKTDTPETDQAMKFCFGTDDEYILPKVAERLERERDEARKIAEKFQSMCYEFLWDEVLPWANAKVEGGEA
jgi:hypothetical protein